MNNEADLHLEVYRHLQNSIDPEIVRNPEEGLDTGYLGVNEYDLEYTNIEAEKRINSPENLRGERADIVVNEKSNGVFLCMEIKYLEDNNPKSASALSEDVIQQVCRYGLGFGSNYLATLNEKEVAVFKNVRDPWDKPVWYTQCGEQSDSTAEHVSTILYELAQYESGKIKWEEGDLCRGTLRECHEEYYLPG